MVRKNSIAGLRLPGPVFLVLLLLEVTAGENILAGAFDTRPTSLLDGIHSVFDVKVVDAADHDIFGVWNQTCQWLKEGRRIFFVPQNAVLAQAVASVALHTGAMVVATHWQEDGVSPRQHLQAPVINMHPEGSTLKKAYKDIVKGLGWSSFLILYDDADKLKRIENLLEENTGHLINFKDMEDAKWKEIHNLGVTHFIIETSDFDGIFAKLKLHGLLRKSYGIFVTSIGGAEYLRGKLTDMENLDVYAVQLMENDSLTNGITVDEGLLLDGANYILSQSSDLNHSNNPFSSGATCESPLARPTPILMSSFHPVAVGETGPLQLTADGFRTNFKLKIVNIGKNDSPEVAGWTPRGGFAWTREPEEEKLIVSTIVTKPYVSLSGDKIEGFAVDLLDEISKIIGVKYEMKVVEDGRYGSYHSETKEWNGMIGEVLHRRADLAISDVTITTLRSKAVDFSVPFMATGISILYMKSSPPRTTWNVLTSPFSTTVWIYTGLAYLAVTLVLFFLRRFNPSEGGKDPSMKTVYSSVSVFASLTHHESQDSAKSVSLSLVRGVWYLFAFVMIACYTANLAAFLTVGRAEFSTPIKTVEDLARQSTIKYGAIRGGSTMSFFKDSSTPIYQMIWNTMKQDPKVLVSSSAEGIERVLEGGYAFFMESSTIDYILPTNCDLVRLGSQLDYKAYGIALPHGSPYRSAINSAILMLQENGKLAELKTLWWVTKRGGETCKHEEGPGKVVNKALGPGDVGSVFILLVVGLCVACFVGIGEYYWAKRNNTTHRSGARWDHNDQNVAFSKSEEDI